MEQVSIAPKWDDPTRDELNMWLVGVGHNLEATPLCPTKRKQRLKTGVGNRFRYVDASGPPGHIIRIYTRQAFEVQLDSLPSGDLNALVTTARSHKHGRVTERVNSTT